MAADPRQPHGIRLRIQLWIGTGLLLLLVGAQNALAREEVREYSIAEALNSAEATRRLSGATQFFFGRQAYPEPEQNHGTYKTQKRTDTSAQSSRAACTSAFISAMAALEDRAELEGGNAVVDIASTYDDIEVQSRSDFRCGATKVMAGVALQGRVVTLPGQHTPPQVDEPVEPPQAVRPF